MDEERYLIEAGRMVSRLVHDFKNQIGGLKLYSAYLKKRFEDDPEIKEVVDKVIFGLDEMAAQSILVRDLTRPLNLVTDNCDLSAVIEAAISDNKRLAEALGVSIALEIQEASSDVRADARQLQTALGAIIARAVKTSDKGATVKIRLSPEYRVAIIEVSNPDVSASDEKLPDIFNFVGSDRITSAALGMVMAKRIVELHGGKISAAGRLSDDVRETVIHFEIPSG